MDKRVEHDEHLPAPPDVVWEELTGMDGWLGETDLEPAEGAEGRITLEGELHHVLVDEVDPHRRLALRWWPIDPGSGVGPATQVEFTLVPVPGGTQLTVVEFPASRPLGFRAMASIAA